MNLSDLKTSPPGQGERSVMNCTACEKSLPDLLLDPQAAGNDSLRAHLALCPACAEQLHALERTSALLDGWAAPDPSPWFDSRMAARLREAQAAAPEGFWERVRSRLLFNTGRQFRPALAGALALALLAGGGAAAEFTGVLHLRQPEMSATVEDLQILDRNDQAIQTMDQLLDDNNDGGDDNSPSS